MPLIEVVGSVNVDLVSRTPRLPNAGETLRASSFDVGFGGKGANQAVACARMVDRDASIPARVRMIGAVGNDQFGRDSLNQLKHEHIDYDGVTVLEGHKTGSTVIIVEEESGENRILFTPGANYAVTASQVVLDPASRGNVVLFQLELPLETVVDALKKAKSLHKVTILNPAPASALPDHCFTTIDYLVVNESEASALSGIPEASLLSSLDQAADLFISKGVQSVVITLGAKGVYWRSAAQQSTTGNHIDAHPVKVIDTTAAGDTFLGAFAEALTEHDTSLPGEDKVQNAIRRANYAASLSVQREGAQASIPFRHELQEMTKNTSSDTR
ncbi:MAG: hypothetical protein Q9162_004379 [Coniocarpon cinnabarinum]